MSVQRSWISCVTISFTIPRQNRLWFRSRTWCIPFRHRWFDLQSKTRQSLELKQTWPSRTCTTGCTGPVTQNKRNMSCNAMISTWLSFVTIKMFRVKGPISFQFMRALSKAETLGILSTNHVEFVHKLNKVKFCFHTITTLGLQPMKDKH